MLKIVKNIVDGIKLNIEYFKSISEDDDSIFFHESEIHERGYIIKQNTIKLIQNNASMCLCTIIDFNGRYVPCLYIDSIFKMLSKETQEFIIQHEMGHFNYHLDIMLNNSEIKRTIELEYQADEYAMEQVGYSEAMKALDELKTMGRRMQYGFGKYSPFARELNKRIKHLMEVHKANNN